MTLRLISAAFLKIDVNASLFVLNMHLMGYQLNALLLVQADLMIFFFYLMSIFYFFKLWSSSMLNLIFIFSEL